MNVSLAALALEEILLHIKKKDRDTDFQDERCAGQALS
jgi:hypothetical protein